MGFASYWENISERYYESMATIGGWLGEVSRSTERRDIEEASFLHGDPFERAIRVIDDFWRLYNRARPGADMPVGWWPEHLQNVYRLHAILSVVPTLDEHDPATWTAIRAIESELHD